MDEWLAMIKDVGFPIVITFFLLSRIESKLDELIQSVQKLPYMQMAASPPGNVFLEEMKK
ncbi:YvrJ family protein [Terrilactibacillus sp. S3-3]|nr:YvrJ family protein [Terrilactibacillus sp. S3-3]